MDDGSVRREAEQRIDVARLPADVVELIDNLAPGESLTIARDSAPIATIVAARSADTGRITNRATPDEQARQPSATAERAMIVATALPLSSQVRSMLSAQLGEGYVVLDFNSAPPSADVLLVGPVSLKLLGSLRQMFPAARVMVVEIEDEELGVTSNGPVRRLIDAGTEAYLISSSVSDLALQLDRVVTHRPQLTGRARVQAEIDTAPSELPDTR